MERLELTEGGFVLYERGFVPAAEADALLARLLRETPWEQGEIAMFGKKLREPRLTAWYGELDYVYSGRRLQRAAWTDALQALRQRVEATAGSTFNAVLLNRYRDGNDSMGLHADDEPELGANPVVASVSLGATRRFVLEPRRGAARRAGRLSFDLAHGDLLIMAGSCQHHYRHGAPKQPSVRDERVNLTFRRVLV